MEGLVSSLATTKRSQIRCFMPYRSYKDSGFEWIGEIPTNWQLKRLKFLLRAPLKYGANEVGDWRPGDFVHRAVRSSIVARESFESVWPAGGPWSPSTVSRLAP